MHWYKFFFVTQSEKRGTLLLIGLVAVLFTARMVLAQYKADPTLYNSHSPIKTANIINPVELNTADTTQLKQLQGIGSGFANMIVNYRNKLGGFYRKEQLLEVYHFPPQTFQNIQHQLHVDTTLITKIPLNTATIQQLKRHPYIRYFQAKSLVENRQARPHVRYNSLHDIVLDKDVTEAFLQKIAPYLSFQ
ncbi:MAG: helix-hairpin-helix domain-containing protein [Paludibacteraceae bacterium]|nr:helix-hairpin-helix domain-containing protein [Paludibacteraceae bacterium]